MLMMQSGKPGTGEYIADTWLILPIESQVKIPGAEEANQTYND